ncbi:hypothetical protein PAXINDRAFT_86563, partial [Paxillus involutus ATCC 200175]
EDIIGAWQQYFMVLQAELAVGHFTMDNASNNKTCMQELETLLRARDIEFDALDRLVMCFLHVMHICTTHVIKSFTDDELTAIADTWIGVLPDEDECEAYVEAVRLDPITMGHDIELKDYVLSCPQWLVLEDFEHILQVPHKVQQCMSSESLPRLGSAVPCFELFMSAWEMLGATHPRVKPWTDIGLEWATKYYQRMDNMRAYVIAMFVDPATRMLWIKAYWDDEYIASAEKTVLEMMQEYRWKLPESATTQQKGKAPAHTIDSLAAHFGIKDMGIRQRGPRSQTTVTSDEEYRAYINGDLWEEDSDPLKFWESKRKSYPTIFAIALDHLPIQASAVPCEQIFSSSAETDTKKRNRISPTLMEALQMLKYDFKKCRLNFTDGMKLDQCDLLKDEPNEPELSADGARLAQDEAVDAIIGCAGREEGNQVATDIIIIGS